MRISDWSSDVCSSDLECASAYRGDDPSPSRHRIVGDQPRFGMRAVEPVDDRKALDDRFAVGDEHRHETLRILRQIGVAFLLAGDQADLDALVGKAFQVQRDPDPIAGRGAEIIVEDERSEEHTSELQSLMRISYAVFCLKNKKNKEQ